MSSAIPNFAYRAGEKFVCGNEVLLDLSDAPRPVRCDAREMM